MATTLKQIEKVEGRREGGTAYESVHQWPMLDFGQGPLKGHGNMHIGQVLPNIWNPRLARVSRWILRPS